MVPFGQKKINFGRRKKIGNPGLVPSVKALVAREKMHPCEILKTLLTVCGHIG